MKKTKIIFWIFTVLLCLFLGLGAFFDLIMHPEALAMFKHLELPAHLSPFLGAAKLLGLLAIVVPGFPRIKEWAYAGLCFDMVGAIYCGLAIDDPPAQWLPVLIGFVLLFGSYFFYHKRLKEAGMAAQARLA